MTHLTRRAIPRRGPSGEATKYRHVVTSGEPHSATFVFADIAGYTALTEAHGDADAAELAAKFCRAISEVAADSGGEVIKTIGDAVMCRHSVPSEAVALGLTAAHEVIAGHGFPAVRVGMHHGPAIARDGDWFGATVNLAARVAAVAAGGEVLLTGAVREGAGELAGPRPAGLQPQHGLAGVERETAGGVQQAVAQRLGFANGELVVEA